MLLRSLLLLLLVIHSVGCVTSLNRDPEFRPYLTQPQTIQRQTLLFELGPYSKRHRGETHHLYDKDSGNDWRRVGWVMPGTPVQIVEINRYLTDGGGPWIGASGLIVDPVTNQRVMFLYCWTLGDSLNRAPWDLSTIPEHRDFR